MKDDTQQPHEAAEQAREFGEAMREAKRRYVERRVSEGASPVKAEGEWLKEMNREEE